MSELLKTRAIVLSKMEFRETSLILRLFSEDYGSLSLIAKGARSQKSRTGNIADGLNLIEAVFYGKSNGSSLQLLKEASLIESNKWIKEDLDSLRYACAASELLKFFIPEALPARALFMAVERFFQLLNQPSADSDKSVLFAKFFLYFLKTEGYEISTDCCSCCQKSLEEPQDVWFSYWVGALCAKCASEKPFDIHFTAELFSLLKGLKLKNQELIYNRADMDRIIGFLENYLSHNFQEFSGLRSLKIL